MLRYRAFDLFGYVPPSEGALAKPAAYDDLQWPDPLPPVSNLERVLRAAMRTKRKDGVVTCELGWLFSGFQPDPTL